MESSEEEALFRSQQYTTLYFVQSPTTTVSFHSPTTQRRLTLSHYSSSRGSTNNSLHEKKISYGPLESPDHGGVGGGVVVKLGEKCGDFGGGGNVLGKGGGGVESEEEEEEENRVGTRKRMWDFVSFSRSDPCVWILFQISLRLVVSFGVALLFFYVITKPPSPIVSVKEKHSLYASSNGPTSFLLYSGITNKPMYGAGRSMQDILDSGKGLSLVIHVKFSSRFHVVGKLIRLKYHHRAKCILILKKSHDIQHKTLIFDNLCNLL
ncbi:uncharacterized protein LOC110872638 isoform X2 [Helianthus annuus]|uniref:uncharacterized protein LOC110872638 isoform X2 n=1 Tax=Helianthus annuus TaxID=4232 RepID=UPI000B8FFBD4|nr:uncharacterized protein LOC110872638 isoform X2 [Helianthus annuus]